MSSAGRSATPRSTTTSTGRLGCKGSAVVDDPCWGSPSNCSLDDLLKLVSRDASILYESDDYLVLNKPPDLRMDGPFPSTVQKLLSHWYRPVAVATTAGDSSEGAPPPPPTSEEKFRPCHQLDYATSGVLLVARNAASANQAREMFESRSPDLRKSYVAVVRGHVKVPTASQVPVLSKEEVHARLSRLEDSHRKSQRKRHRKPHTFQGYQPPHSLFQQWQWQQQQQQQSLDNAQIEALSEDCPDRRQRRKRSRSRLSTEQWDSVWRAVRETDLSARLQEEPGQWNDWASIKSQDVYRRAFEDAARVYNSLPRMVKEQQSTNPFAEGANDHSTDSGLPPMFRDDESDASDAFYVSVPLAEHPDEFAMRVPPEYVATSASRTGRLRAGDEATMEYKPALTMCRIVRHSFLVDELSGRSHPVTKIALHPKTGRRHQLRVHMAFLGHEIVGDKTYGEGTNPTCHRMCLHSASLTIPGLHFEAPDPFPEAEPDDEKSSSEIIVRMV
jgi:23S rRNA-/tRNA-specific pseudouridylate synthase